MTPFQQHVAKWSVCRLCELCKTRKNVVLARGVVPCDVLFLGEAPGDVEDVFAKPFWGPAGQLLDTIIYESGFHDCTGLTFAMTNLAACVPKDEGGAKSGEPTDVTIKACAPRLREFVAMCRPRLIVCVGDLAAQWLDRVIPHRQAPSVKIQHPASIMRADISQRGLLVQRAVVILSDAISELV